MILSDKKCDVYKRVWMRKYRKRKRQEQLFKKGHCPYCGMFMKSDYHQKFPCETYIRKIIQNTKDSLL